MKRYGKTLISLAFVVTLFATIGASSAFADMLGGAIFGGMAASGVEVLGGAGATAAMVEGAVGLYTNETSVPIGLNDYSLYYRKHAKTETTESGAIDYDYLWFSPEYAQYLQSEGLGYIADKSINPNTAGTLVSGAGTVAGIPIFNVSGSLRSQKYYAPTVNSSYNMGSILIEPSISYFRQFRATYNGTAKTSTTSSYNAESYFYTFIQVTNGSATLNGIGKYFSGTINPAIARFSTYDASPFSFTYTASSIDTSALPSTHGLSLYIPHTYYQNSSGTDVISDSGSYSITSDASTMQSLFNGINTATAENAVIDQTYEPYSEVTPTPEPTVIPDTNLGEVPYSTFLPDVIGLFEGLADDFTSGVDTLGNDLTEVFNSARDTIGQKIDSLSQTLSDVADTVGRKVDSVTSAVTSSFASLQEAIADLIAQVIDLPAALENHLITTFNNSLDALKSTLAPFFNRLKSFLGIWHYVVEWLQSISAPFTLFLRFFSGMSSIAMLPIYATIAGTIVISVYRRFGR